MHLPTFLLSAHPLYSYLCLFLEKSLFCNMLLRRYLETCWCYIFNRWCCFEAHLTLPIVRQCCLLVIAIPEQFGYNFHASSLTLSRQKTLLLLVFSETNWRNVLAYSKFLRAFLPNSPAFQALQQALAVYQ